MNWDCYSLPAKESRKAAFKKRCSTKNTKMTYQIVSERKLRHTVKIGNPKEAYKLVKRYADKKQEYFILLTLNGAHNVISVSIVTIGIANKTLIHPREVFFKAICDCAVAIIVCHNHPSGAVIPSDEDKEITKDIYLTGEIIGIPLIDHIIISKTGYSSFKEQGVSPWDRRNSGSI
jgi:DNA repair protein RadC